MVADWFVGFAGFEALKGNSNVPEQLFAANDLPMPGFPTQKPAIMADIKSGKLPKEVVDTALKEFWSWFSSHW
ncbi:hypothetical protein [Rufibacter tibetensis]|uniref:Uncharacterized protein n=1 Tax=Rufibacter tibetensis TaxID=512763 RepID=A0A0P0D1P8_9BACT|nr:hypothetical protein [Rufibacter tibetensis]ALJ01699.1 hypothetical protein DC20_21855 [Rufibacter tibetensis]